jgi:hypothetical protein
LDVVSPDGFEDEFVEGELIGEGESRTAPEEPVHLGEDEAELLPLSEDVGAPGEFPVQMKSEIFDVISCGKL